MAESNNLGKPKRAPPKKSRSHSCISYLTEEQIHYCIQRKQPYIRHWAYIKHDKDTKEDGTLKEPHYHILVWTIQQTTDKTIREWFKINDVEANTLSQTVINSDDIVDYMTHDGTPDKYQYTENDIVSSDWEWFKTNADNSPAYQCLEDMLSGEKLINLAKNYGREFIVNYEKYSKLANAIIYEENQEK